MASESDFIICGWYTPDYTPWANNLIQNLDDLGLPHDIIAVPALSGGWEKITMGKAAHVLAAIDRNPGKTIIFLDVDCEVIRADKVRELVQVDGDVAFYLKTRFRRAGGIKWETRSGTLVVQPTQEARKFVEVWRDISAMAPIYSIDQDSLAVAMGRVPGCVFHILDVRHCAIAYDKVADPWIFHSSASFTIPKARKWKRRIARFFSFLKNTDAIANI